MNDDAEKLSRKNTWLRLIQNDPMELVRIEWIDLTDQNKTQREAAHA